MNDKSPKGRVQNQLSDKYCINSKIKGDSVYVIDHEGNNLGLQPKSKALRIAEDAGLDLVQVGQKEEIAVTKVMDFGKFSYEKKKQVNDSKKNQKTMQLKEIKLRPNIGDQDYHTKLKRAEEFFLDGKKVKFTLQFRGREITMMGNLGPKIFERITTDLGARNVGTLVEEKDQRGGSFWSKIYFIKAKS